MFLGMHQRGPRGYFSMPCIKPSKKTVRGILKLLRLGPGINKIVMDGLASAMSSLPEDQRDAIVIFDELAGKAFYTYNAASDRIYGFPDLGNGDIRDGVADEIMVCMIRFIYSSRKQVIAWWNTNRKLDASDFQKMFYEAIQGLLAAGVKVRAVSTDSLGKNKSALFRMGASGVQPWFFVNETKIFVIFDVPHLLKALRNALLKYILRLPNGDHVKFEYIKMFALQDMQMTPRIAKKLSMKHLNPGNFDKMTVLLAAQIFSLAVALGVLVYAFLGALPREAIPTGRFLERINNLFDSWNGTEVIEQIPGEQVNFKCALTDSSPHIQLWREMSQEMAGWNFLGSKNLVFDENWMISMTAVYHLWQDLKNEGKQYLPVGVLNSDVIENTNSQMRQHGGHRHNPSVQDVPSAFAGVLVNNLTAPAKGKNCKDDRTLNVVNLQHLYDAAKADQKERGEVSVIPEETPIPILAGEMEESDDDEEDDIHLDDDEEEDALPVTVTAPHIVARMNNIAAGAVARPLVERHMKLVQNCPACEKILLTEPQFPLHLAHTLSATPAMIDQKLPSPAITEVITVIFETAAIQLPPISYKPDVLKTLVEIVSRVPLVQNFQVCPHHISTKASFIKNVAASTLQDFVLALNQDLKKKKAEQKSRKLQRVSHE